MPSASARQSSMPRGVGGCTARPISAGLVASAALPDAAAVPAEADPEEVQRAAWQSVVHAVTPRVQTGTPPPAAWLIQFLSTSDQP